MKKAFSLFIVVITLSCVIIRCASVGKIDKDGNLVINDGVTSIGKEAFMNNQLTSLTIPDSVAAFNSNVFSGARNLTRISIGANVSFIGTERLTPNIDVTVAGAERLAFNFESYYKSNNLQAGIYTFSNGRWNFQPR
jgi:hypothetical protein